MFTGFIKEIGTVSRIKKTSSGLEFTVQGNNVPAGVKQGTSIAVNGVCQTVIQFSKTYFSFDTVQSTLRKTTLAQLRIGDRVNLESALILGDPMDGHLVQGHVNETITLLRKTTAGKCCIMTFERTSTSRVTAEGSTAIDGVSLTVSKVADKYFSVSIIPETMGKTIFQYKKPGDKMNIEYDMMNPVQLAIPKERVNEKNLRAWGYL